MKDELNEPLGRNLGRGPAPPTAPHRQFPRQFGVAAGALLVTAAASTYMWLPYDPYAGEPHVVARIEPAKPPEPAPPPAAVAGAFEPETPGDRVATASEIEEFPGVKVTRGGGAESTARIIRVEAPSGVKLAPAPDRRLVEKGAYGLLPRIGADGARPMDVYGRPFVTSPAIKPGAPKIAIVLGGVGLNPQATAAAIGETPESLTLAFAPYGGDIDRIAAQARARGHETLLQAPMEPFDFPQNNPGPHTLTVDAAEGGLDDLHWLMSRFSGYAGVMNHLGGRYMADATALSATLADIGQRGLFFLDDGASPQSLVSALAPKFAVPHARVDIVLDQRGAPQSLDAALAQLEVIARDKGSAIGFANAMPATITRIARFARDVEKRGIALAPVSAVLAPRAASADARGSR